MSKIDDLIKQLCPMGVAHNRLGDAIQLKKGKQLNKNFLNENGQYPAYNGGISFSGYTDTYNYDENTIIISQGGASAGFVNFVKTKFYANAHCYVILPNEEKIINKYLFYFFKLNQKKLTEKQHGAGIPALSTKEILEMSIPLPPLSIQNEIVNILDMFTDLTEVLEEELEIRKQQFTFYRDQLLCFEGKKVEWKMFGEIYEFKNGLNKGKEFFGKGTPIVNFTDVFKNLSLNRNELKGKVDVTFKEKQLYSAKRDDLFFTRTSETQEDIGMCCALMDDIEDCVFSGFVLRARPKTKLLLPKFCSYYFTSRYARKEIVKQSTFTTRALTSGSRLSKIKLPIPSLSEQKRIVSILDQLHALINDFSIGLPAEISARRKQYEYYRNKLLTFKQLNNE